MDLARHVLTSFRSRWADQRGAAMVLVAGSMIALISAVALAVDVGMLTVAKTEAQQVADGAALAGAGALILSPDNVEFATAEAIYFSSRNEIRGTQVVVLPEDVDVDTDRDRVTVRVLRTQERGNPVGTFFASVFGVNTVNISTYATARASPAAGINCLLPVALPDRWYEAPGNDERSFDTEDGDYYIPWMNTSTDPATVNDNYTGYSSGDIGTPIVLHVCLNPPSAFQVSSPFELAGHVARHSPSGFAIKYDAVANQKVRRMVDNAAAIVAAQD